VVVVLAKEKEVEDETNHRKCSWWNIGKITDDDCSIAGLCSNLWEAILVEDDKDRRAVLLLVGRTWHLATFIMDVEASMIAGSSGGHKIGMKKKGSIVSVR